MRYPETSPIIDSEFDLIPDTDRMPELPSEEAPQGLCEHVRHHVSQIIDKEELDFKYVNRD